MSMSKSFTCIIPLHCALSFTERTLKGQLNYLLVPCCLLEADFDGRPGPVGSLHVQVKILLVSLLLGLSYKLIVVGHCMFSDL
jgi:hypothetical protein